MPGIYGTFSVDVGVIGCCEEVQVVSWANAPFKMGQFFENRCTQLHVADYFLAELRSSKKHLPEILA